MATQFSSIEPRGKRRLRLSFAGFLNPALPAYVPALYSVTCMDGAGPSPSVVAVLYVPSQLNEPCAVELALGHDLVDGGAYSVTCTNIPCLPSGAVSGTLTTKIGALRQRPTEALPTLRDSLLSFLGEDLIWEDGDFGETADGDLATHSGPNVVEAQVNACVESDGLPWDPAYGAKLRQFVDGSPASMPRAVGQTVRAIVRDDRIVRAAGELVDDEIQLAVELVGQQLLTVNSPIKAA